MDWHISGAYIASCSCELEEHWPIDGTLGDTHGGCKGAIVFAIQQGTSDKADLSGVTFAVVNFFPEDKDGLWEMGLVVDEEATGEQVQAIEEIISGRHGGPFEDLAEMVGEYLGHEKFPITIERSASPIVKIGSSLAFKFVATTDESGARVAGGKPLLPWATERVGGSAAGPPGRLFAQVWTSHFAEYARFDIDSERLAVEDQLGRLKG